MISSDFMRGYNDVIILSILAEGESYGYIVSKAIKTRTNDLYIIKETTLYSAFTRLEKNGYIESFDKEDASMGSKRVYYRITKKGKDLLSQKKEEWQITSDVISKFLGGKK